MSLPFSEMWYNKFWKIFLVFAYLYDYLNSNNTAMLKKNFRSKIQNNKLEYISSNSALFSITVLLWISLVFWLPWALLLLLFLHFLKWNFQQFWCLLQIPKDSVVFCDPLHCVMSEICIQEFGGCECIPRNEVLSP